ncbi:MAG: extracellular solute-binding protein, partial [Clostridiales bacterium]|nr:extracellular solute-binding protein [Clostridiales bacterium]
MKKLLSLLLMLAMLFCSPALSEGIAGEPGTYPIVDEPCELNIFYTSNPFPDNWEIDTNWFTQYYEELTGIHINYEGVSGDPVENAQKVNLKLVSSDLPDVFSKCNFTRAQEVMYGSEGIFIPLNDLIDNETIYIKKMFEDYPHLRDQVTAPDGNIYGIPEVILYVHGTVEDKMWVNQVWLDALNMEKPT